MTVLIAVNGVLRDEFGTPLPDGLRLYRALATTFPIALACDDDRKLVAHFLRVNNVEGFGFLIGPDVALPDVDLRVRQIEAMSTSSRITMLVDPDPARILLATHMGINGVLWSRPTSSYYRWRPGTDKRSWAELMDDNDRRREQKASTLVETDVELANWE